MKDSAHRHSRRGVEYLTLLMPFNQPPLSLCTTKKIKLAPDFFVCAVQDFDHTDMLSTNVEEKAKQASEGAQRAGQTQCESNQGDKRRALALT